jgi:hypothetical protein
MVDVPAGLLAYFSDRKTEAAVNLLLNKQRPDVPDDVSWSEVPAYFRALRAARQIEVDYAIFLHEIWGAVWKAPPKPWVAREPHEQVDDALVDPRRIFSQNYAVRVFERDKLWCELLVYGHREAGIQIGFNVYQGQRSKLPKALPDWENDEGTRWSPSNLVKLKRTIDLTPLRTYADNAMKEIKSLDRD